MPDGTLETVEGAIWSNMGQKNKLEEPNEINEDQKANC